jgi:hypothetical protein
MIGSVYVLMLIATNNMMPFGDLVSFERTGIEADIICVNLRSSAVCLFLRLFRF